MRSAIIHQAKLEDCMLLATGRMVDWHVYDCTIASKEITTLAMERNDLWIAGKSTSNYGSR
jgi:hypothetical protein